MKLQSLVEALHGGAGGVLLAGVVAVVALGCGGSGSTSSAPDAGDTHAPDDGAVDYGVNDRAIDAGADSVHADATSDAPSNTTSDAGTDTAQDAPADVLPSDAVSDVAPSDAAPSDTPQLDAADSADALSLTSTTVQQIQTGAVAVGAGVSLSVYVTALDAQNRSLWVSDSATQVASSGIYAYRGPTAAVLDGIVVGLRIDLGAVVSSFHGLLELTPLPGGDVSLVPGGAVAVAIVPASVTLATVAGNPAYVGTVVRVANVKVTASAVAGTAHVYTLAAGAATATMGEQLFIAGASVGTCYATVTGVLTLDTTTDPGTPLLLPRSAPDLVTGGVCP